MDHKGTQSRFNVNNNYDEILKNMKEEFLKKWDCTTTSQNATLDDYESLAILGAGSFGKVKLCREKNTKICLAVKYLSKEHIVKRKQIKHTITEKQVMYSTSFPFLVGLEFSRKDNDFLYIAMPFFNGGELFTYHRNVRKFREHQAKFYASQVFLGLEYLHNNDLVYRDLKPENLLLDSKGYIRITDFGFTKRVKDRTATLCGTPEYFAPELIQARPYATSVDWWAFGVFIYEMVAGHSPFSKYSKDPLQMYAKICDSDYSMPAFFTPELKVLVTNLLQVDLSKRYGSMRNGNKDIKNHEWFQSIDWFAILNRDSEAPYIPNLSGEYDTSNFDTYPDTEETKSNYNKYADLFADF